MTRINSGFANAGFPYKLGEYLATGNVVIATKVSDVENYLENYKDAILIEPNDKDQLRIAMKFCIENEEQSIQIGKNGQLKCEKYFNPDINSQLLFNLLAGNSNE